LLRRLLLHLSERPRARDLLLHTPGARRAVARFVAGETLEAAVRVARDLNARRMAATLDFLGEKTTSAAEAEAAALEYETILGRIARERLDANASLKLTQFGLDVDPALAGGLVRRLLDRAREIGTFIGLDMEGSAYTQRTLDLYRVLRAAGYHNMELALQSYLYRTARDVADLLPLRPRIRLVKGAYAEPASIAYPRKADVDASYRRLAERLLLETPGPAIATHDERLIRHVMAFAGRHGISPSGFEFQMLFGIRRDLQAHLADQGYRVRVYVPFGSQWFPYFMRRLAERPANLGFVLRSLLTERRRPA